MTSCNYYIISAHLPTLTLSPHSKKPPTLPPSFPPSLLLHQQTTPFLTFNIGSVDSFERNLEQAQRELGIDPANHIPVTYSSESAWLQNLIINTLPTLFLIGAFVYFGRRVSGGSAGRGVSWVCSSCM